MTNTQTKIIVVLEFEISDLEFIWELEIGYYFNDLTFQPT